MPLFGRKKGSGKANRTKILFATDLHGSQHTFGKLLRVLDIWDPDAFIMGGDVAGKGLIPVLEENGRGLIRWMGEDIDVPIDEIGEYEDRASQLGFYPARVDQDGLERLQADDKYRDDVFDRLMYERWGEWLDRLEARCEELELPAWVIAGNDDPWTLDELSDRERNWVKGANERIVPVLDHWQMLSVGVANETPWGCPRDIPDEELREHLDKLAGELESFESVITNIHVPPYGRALDLATELDTSVDPPKPITGSTAAVGSKAVTEFLEERQPLLSLHGHIHESPGAVDIGRTKAINPGSEFAEGILRGVLITIEPDCVVGHQFVTG